MNKTLAEEQKTQHCKTNMLLCATVNLGFKFKLS